MSNQVRAGRGCYPIMSSVIRLFADSCGGILVIPGNEAPKDAEHALFEILMDENGSLYGRSIQVGDEVFECFVGEHDSTWTRVYLILIS